MRYVIKSSYTMTLRENHNHSGAKLKSMFLWQTASGNELWEVGGEKWLHVKEISGKPVDGWIAIVSGGKTYCTLTDTGAAPPPVDPPVEPPIDPTPEDVIAIIKYVDVIVEYPSGKFWTVKCIPQSAVLQ